MSCGIFCKLNTLLLLVVASGLAFNSYMQLKLFNRNSNLALQGNHYVIQTITENNSKNLKVLSNDIRNSYRKTG